MKARKNLTHPCAAIDNKNILIDKRKCIVR